MVLLHCCIIIIVVMLLLVVLLHYCIFAKCSFIGKSHCLINKIIVSLCTAVLCSCLFVARLCWLSAVGSDEKDKRIKPVNGWHYHPEASTRSGGKATSTSWGNGRKWRLSDAKNTRLSAEAVLSCGHMLKEVILTYVEGSHLDICRRKRNDWNLSIITLALG